MDMAEREQLKKEIMQELESKYTGVTIRENVQEVLEKTREKWFKNAKFPDMLYRASLMAKAFNSTQVAWKAWDSIRHLTCFICGVGHVRRLEDSRVANEIAEILCQTVYDLRMKYFGGKTNE